MRITTPLVILAATLATLACGPRNKDQLADNELATATAGTKVKATDGRCMSQAVHDEVRHQLFVRAAEIRGSNGGNYARIADFSVLQIDAAVAVTPVALTEMVDCRGRAVLRLPAGLRVAGGRTALVGDIAFSVASGSPGPVTLGPSEAIAIPLATLTQNRAAATDQASTPSASRPEPVQRAPEAPSAPSPPPRPDPVISRSAEAPSVRPSFNCQRARTSSERAVCSSDSLAALDRDMSAQYREALAGAGPEQRRLLGQTRDRFLGYRNRCNSDSCIANTYRGRMREIDDIAAGRWRGQR